MLRTVTNVCIQRWAWPMCSTNCYPLCLKLLEFKAAVRLYWGRRTAGETEGPQFARTSLEFWFQLPYLSLLNPEVADCLGSNIIGQHVLELPFVRFRACLCVSVCSSCALMLSFLTLVFLPVFFPPLLLAFSFSTFPSFCLPDLKDFQNNKHRYLLASENQRPGNFSTASMGSLTSSPSSCSLSSQVGLTSVTSIQERIMSTPGGEEAIERLKVSLKLEHTTLYAIPEGRTRTEWMNISKVLS